MAKRVWCVKHSEGWCAVKSEEKPVEEATSVETACDHFITLPLGSQKRVPTCAECRAALAEERGR